MRNRKDGPETGAFIRRFGTWNNALKSVGLDYNKKAKYNSRELIILLRRLAKKIGRTPRMEDIDNTKNYPHSSVYLLHFKTARVSSDTLANGVGKHADTVEQDPLRRRQGVGRARRTLAGLVRQHPDRRGGLGILSTDSQETSPSGLRQGGLQKVPAFRDRRTVATNPASDRIDCMEISCPSTVNEPAASGTVLPSSSASTRRRAFATGFVSAKSVSISMAVPDGGASDV